MSARFLSIPRSIPPGNSAGSPPELFLPRLFRQRICPSHNELPSPGKPSSAAQASIPNFPYTPCSPSNLSTPPHSVNGTPAPLCPQCSYLRALCVKSPVIRTHHSQSAFPLFSLPSPNPTDKLTNALLVHPALRSPPHSPPRPSPRPRRNRLDQHGHRGHHDGRPPPQLR